MGFSGGDDGGDERGMSNNNCGGNGGDAQEQEGGNDDDDEATDESGRLLDWAGVFEVLRGEIRNVSLRKASQVKITT